MSSCQKKTKCFPRAKWSRELGVSAEQRAEMPTKASDAPTQNTQLQPSSAETKILSHL